MEWEAVPVFPYLVLPEAPGLPGPILDVPKADLPSYKPLVVPPSALRPPPGIEGINSNSYDEAPKDTKPSATPAAPIKPYVPPEAQIIAVPFTDIEVPMPTTTIMTTAATTAFISVAATLIGQSLFKYLVSLFKPIIKTAWNKLKKKQLEENPKTS
jgi:hypothetical protein